MAHDLSRHCAGRDRLSEARRADFWQKVDARRGMVMWALAGNPARHFYEALGGVFVASQPVEIGGLTLEEVAYGWDDLGVLEDAIAMPR